MKLTHIQRLAIETALKSLKDDGSNAKENFKVEIEVIEEMLKNK